MKKIQVKQYTIRNISHALDLRLRQKSQELGKSLNELVLNTLSCGVGLIDTPPLHHDMDALIGTWKEDPDFEKALREQDQIDLKLWS